MLYKCLVVQRRSGAGVVELGLTLSLESGIHTGNCNDLATLSSLGQYQNITTI